MLYFNTNVGATLAGTMELERTSLGTRYED